MTAGHLHGGLQLLGQCDFSCSQEQGEGLRTANPGSGGVAARPCQRSPDTWPGGPGSGPGPAPALDDLVLGRYRLLECLGAGGFGVVWRAHDELLHREVAVKRIPLAPGEDGERASREALASARLAHPAIVALYEACAEQDAFY